MDHCPPAACVLQLQPSGGAYQAAARFLDNLGLPNGLVVLQTPMTHEQQWGLTACGRAGATSIDVDESLGSAALYEFEISKPQWSIRCRVNGTDIAQRFLDFVTTSDVKEMIVGTCDGHSVSVRREDEFADRFFIVVEFAAGRIEFTIAGAKEVNELASALRQAIEGL